jgi:Ni/Co efflux regulator RcnB
MNRLLLALALATIVAAPAAASGGKTQIEQLRSQHNSQHHRTMTERTQAPADDWMPCDYYHIDVPGNCA